MIESHNEPDDWDDSVILKVFHDSLRKHTTREKRVQDEIDIDNHKSSDMGSKQRLNNPAALGKRKLDDVVFYLSVKTIPRTDIVFNTFWGFFFQC